jgi:hypothetical protein
MMAWLDGRLPDGSPIPDPGSPFGAAGTLLGVASATGVQLYDAAWDEHKKEMTWLPAGPSAHLADYHSQVHVGDHGLYHKPPPPAPMEVFWRSDADGSSVIGVKVHELDAGDAVPHLRLQAYGSGGISGRVHEVHRIATAGGKPLQSASEADYGQPPLQVPYTAVYLFWGDAPDATPTDEQH